MNDIILGDCLEVMRGFDDECIDLTVTSPPYDNLRTYGGYSFDFEPIARELYRVTKDGGVVVWVVGDQTKDGSESGTSFKQALFFMECGFNLYDTMIYQKLNYAPLTHNRYEQAWEYMFVFSKGKPKTFNPIMEASTWAGKLRYGKEAYYKKNDGVLVDTGKREPINKQKIRSNIFAYQVGSLTETAKFKHPAMFPLKLAKDQIRSWSNEGNTILDPFCGSGTTLKAAKDLGREYIGVEINPEYVKIAQDRLKQEVLL